MASTGFSTRYEAYSGTNRLKNLLFVMLCILIAAVITGCGEVEEEAATIDLTGDNAATVGMVGAMKTPIEAAPAAPSAPTDGTPYVKSVGYYSDWELTEEIDSETPVPVGTTIYIHIVFSEPMWIRVTDNQEGHDPRPVFYYWVNGNGTRFRMMPHGSQGEDFVSGDAKPKGDDTDDFVCKYRVRAKDNGSQFWIRVGKWSADLERNNMKEAYAHKPRLRLGEDPEEESEEVVEEPAEEDSEPTVVGDAKEEAITPAPEEVTPLTIVSITHYRDREDTIIPEGESVAHNTTVRTEIMFTEPIDPESVVVTYTTGGETKRFSYSTGGVHWRGLFQMSRDRETIICKQFAREDIFVVTLLAAEGLTGNTLTEPIKAPEVPVGTQTVIPAPEPQTPVEVPPTTPDEPTQPIVSQPRQPTVPSQPQVPVTSGDADYSFEDGVYTVGGETYPGFNPSPKLQHTLNTHSSARLPYFLEAVKMVEVIDWVYRKSWKMYSDWERNQASADKLIATIEAVLNHFGTSLDIGRAMAALYFGTAEIPPPHSKYWFSVEYLRFKLANPGADVHRLLSLFSQSAEQKKIVGIENPNE